MAATVGQAPVATRRARAKTAIAERVRAIPPPAFALGVAILAWVVTFGVLVVRRHHRLWDVDLDMGIYDQAVWLLAHGRGFITVRGLPVFGHHASFGLALFVPASWLGAGPDFLNVTQVVVLALGAVPLYLLARDRQLGTGVAATLGAVLLAHPAVQFFTWELFHPETMAITPLLCAYLCAVRRSWRWFAFWAVLAVSFKEDLAIAVAVIGLVIALRGDRRIGLVTAGLGIAWFVFVVLVLIPAASGHAAHYEGLYSGIGGSPDGIVRTAFTHPDRITSRVFSGESGEFAWKLLLPFGFVPLLAPLAWVFGLPQFLLDVVSDVPWTRTITFRYAGLPVAGLAVATVEGVALLRRRFGSTVASVATLTIAACALAGTLAWGPSPIGAEYDTGWWPPATDPRIDAKRAAIAAVPGDASVSASFTLVPQLSERAEIYSFPNPWRPANWGVSGSGTRDPSRIDWLVVDRAGIGPEDLALLDRILANGNFRVTFDRQGLVVAHRVRG